MKSITFYVEYATNKDKRAATRKDLKNHTGNCIAVDRSTIRIDNHPLLDSNDNIVFDCFGAVHYKENSECATTNCSQGYLTEKCKRVSEKIAQKIHPELLKYLQQ